jgi:Ca2+-binding RTX toxin-like protein
LTEGESSSRQATATFNVQFQERGGPADKIGAGETVTVDIDISGTASANDFAILDVDSKSFAVNWSLSEDGSLLSVQLTNDSGRDLTLQGNPFSVTVHALPDAEMEGVETLGFDIRTASVGSIWETNDEVLYEINDAGVNIRGTGQDNVLMGGAGNDTLNGLGGDDILIGGPGNDDMTGGKGEDTFVWNRSDLGSPGNPASDVLNDFDPLEGDRLDLSSVLDGDEYNLVATADGGRLTLQVTDVDDNVLQNIVLASFEVATDYEAQAALDAMLAADQIIKTG